MHTLIIRNLPADKRLDREAMASIRGGYAGMPQAGPSSLMYPAVPLPGISAENYHNSLSATIKARVEDLVKDSLSSAGLTVIAAGGD